MVNFLKVVLRLEGSSFSVFCGYDHGIRTRHGRQREGYKVNVQYQGVLGSCLWFLLKGCGAASLGLLLEGQFQVSKPWAQSCWMNVNKVQHKIFLKYGFV